jgi:hypothetical protein
MHDYRYTYGDRPLEGYTIQRAAGKGGFGEVYYAISDSGRQVAIKTVQNHEQIELRGIKQCMNLKSPHLVSIFDVKYNDKGQPFVIMEFVSGMSLRDLLNEHPSGVGEQKAAFFLREIAKGLSHLHECGIVHRDLKPGNIFYENGYVKIGDYGLTKAISTSQHSGQTITVGTVHYMAPEIGEGKYDCSIDIYALGILFYEMLTGQVPFFGASPAEILMKHMKAEPELDGVDETFARVIRKALAKNPDERYTTVQEMVEDVFGTEHIRHSVSQFSPESLSMVAEKVAQKADREAAAAPGQAQAQAKTDLTDLGEKIGRRLGEAGDKLAEKMAQAGSQAKQASKKLKEDSISRNQRRILGVLTMVLLSIGIGMIANSDSMAFSSFFMMMGATMGISIARWRLLPQAEPGHWRNWLCAGLGVLLAVLISGGAGARSPGDLVIPLLLLCLIDWWKLTAPERKERIDWGPAIGTSIAGFFITTIFFHGPGVLVAGVIVGTIICVQVVSPFGRAPQASPGPGKPFSPQKSIHNLVERCRTQSCNWKEKLNQPQAEHVAGPPSPSRPTQAGQRPAPGGLRILFIVGCMVFLGIGLSLLIAAGCTMRGDDFTISVAVGVNCLLLALFCLIRSCKRNLISWYRYLIKPSLKLICLMTVVAAAICLGNMRLRGEEEAIAIILIVLPSILYFIIWFIPCRVIEELAGVKPATQPTPPSNEASPHKRVWALAVSALPALGMVFGIQRFYVGKIWTGLLWLCTFGLFGIGQLIDIIMILAGRFRDAEGRPLVHWTAESARQAAYASKQAPQSPVVEVESKKEAKEAPMQAQAVATPDAPRVQAVQPPQQRPSSHVTDFISAVDKLNPLGYLFAAFGTILLVAMLIVGVVAALRIPWLVAAGFPDPGANEEMTKVLGSSWPLLIDRLIHFFCIFLAVASATFFAIGRRRAGAKHIIRAVIGILLMLGALSFLSDMIPQHYYADGQIVNMWQSGQTGPAVEALMAHADNGLLIPATCLFLASIVILAWPPRRSKPVTSTATPAIPTN